MHKTTPQQLKKKKKKKTNNIKVNPSPKKFIYK